MTGTENKEVSTTRSFGDGIWSLTLTMLELALPRPISARGAGVRDIQGSIVRYLKDNLLQSYTDPTA